MKSIRRLVFLLLSLVVVADASAQLKFGAIKVGQVAGETTKTSANHVSAPLLTGDIVTETDTITTGRDGGAILVLASGSMMKLGSDTQLEITRYRMNPRRQTIAANQKLIPAPVAETGLKLSSGELFVDVRRLALSSSFVIRTPLGTAGVRGTIFRLTVQPSPNSQQLFVNLSTLDGIVMFDPIRTTGVKVRPTIPVANGKEILISASPSGDQADPQRMSEIIIRDIPAATAQTASDACASIASVASQTTITVAEQDLAAAMTR